MVRRSIKNSKDFTLVLLQIVERFLNKKNSYALVFRDILAVVLSLDCNINRAALSIGNKGHNDKIEDEEH